MRCSQFILALTLLALPLSAQFAEPHLGEKLRFGQKKTQFTFEADAAIKRAKPNCECTTVRISGKQLIADVDVTSFDEDTSRHIDVWMEDGRKTRVHVSFVVPQAVELNGRSFVWKRKEAPTTQYLNIKIPKGSPVTELLEAGLTGEAFSYQTKTIKKGSEYQIAITPKSTEKKVLNRLVIKTKSSDPQFAQYIIYLSVK